jgi:hypothetical protein
MRRISLALGVLLCAIVAVAQVVAPPEIRDQALRDLQQKHLAELKAVAVAIAAHTFPYRFYFSRVIDLDEEEQQRGDQRSVQFAKFEQKTVIQITGNYYASYSAELLKKEERARRTFQDVMLPILQMEVPQFAAEPAVEGYALEISHHVRKKMLGVSTENPENVVLAIGKAAAARLIAATGEEDRKAALREASIFINKQPAWLWPSETAQSAVEAAAPAQAPAPAPASVPALAPASVPAPVPAAPPPVAAARDASPDALKSLQTAQQPSLDKLVHDLTGAAHFVGYAPPSFISFHKGIYLQLSLTTQLQESHDGSRYKAAALAFDEHIAHLIRPAAAYFKGDSGFDGIDFSTTVHAADKTEGGIAVEYIFSFPSLRCYEEYDCTGQQVINSGFILINGERVSLDLQSAEAGIRR